MKELFTPRGMLRRALWGWCVGRAMLRLYAQARRDARCHAYATPRAALMITPRAAADIITRHVVFAAARRHARRRAKTRRDIGLPPHVAHVRRHRSLRARQRGVRLARGALTPPRSPPRHYVLSTNRPKTVRMSVL